MGGKKRPAVLALSHRILNAATQNRTGVFALPRHCSTPKLWRQTGAGGESRTRTRFPPADSKSAVAAITPRLRIVLGRSLLTVTGVSPVPWPPIDHGEYDPSDAQPPGTPNMVSVETETAPIANQHHKYYVQGAESVQENFGANGWS